jgi:hypothetical protein
MHRKGALYADTEAHLADRERLADPSTLAADDRALEHLDPLTVAFDDSDVHLQGVSGAEIGNVVAQTGAVDEISAVHGGSR